MHSSLPTTATPLELLQPAILSQFGGPTPADADGDASDAFAPFGEAHPAPPMRRRAHSRRRTETGAHGSAAGANGDARRWWHLRRPPPSPRAQASLAEGQRLQRCRSLARMDRHWPTAIHAAHRIFLVCLQGPLAGTPFQVARHQRSRRPRDHPEAQHPKPNNLHFPGHEPSFGFRLSGSAVRSRWHSTTRCHGCTAPVPRLCPPVPRGDTPVSPLPRKGEGLGVRAPH